ncbi:MAG: hypothetical protein GY829_06285 [Gammaproteobacteria bacterium]|nr:hypothetical protein [Gammaproteobacteria bacterium]
MNAIPEQVDSILQLMIGSHELSPQKHIPYDDEVGKAYLEHWIADPKSIVLVNKNVTACYIVSLIPSWWSKKPFASDIFLYSKTPGAGFRLMKEAQKWVDGFGTSIAGEVISTSNANKATDAMYQRLGYQPIGFKYQRGSEQ